ncbi:Protein of unknown function [Nitrosomonas sp. Nm51]|uniref:DUF2934 domain-containing protein n=1 Tax=Nitrosomonas sp. Nm51 TaxID=133720 RepID=UPI0008CCA4F1|nr:DUF2934 domain-containing protein [Nitrosomonas sp. Nm51]SER15158.1 Protein of unknown function [Nitrosomonas sp. Nm51]
MESVKKPLKVAKRTKKKSSATNSKPQSGLADTDRYAHIAVSAYYKAQARGFEPGHELADWLAAEAEQRL